MSITKRDKYNLALRFSEALEDNESSMGEMAAYRITCEQLGISEDDGWNLLKLVGIDIGEIR